VNKKYVILDGVLDRESLIALQQYFITQQDQLKWQYFSNINNKEKSQIKRRSINPTQIDTKVVEDGFTFPIYKFNNENKDVDSNILSIINKIKTNVEGGLGTQFNYITRIKVNLTKPQIFDEQNIIDTIHTDQLIPHTTFIFYINTNDGYTLLYDDNKENVIERVDCVENRVLVFYGLIPHAGVPSTNNDKCIINFNVTNKNNNMDMDTLQSEYGILKDENKIEYKTLFNQHVGQLDDEVTEHLNNGWMPHGQQYNAGGLFYQTVLRVPRQMMQQPR